MQPHTSPSWGELIVGPYVVMSLRGPAVVGPAVAAHGAAPVTTPAAGPPAAATQHPAWTDDASWKHRLTNLRLFLQPFVCASLLLPWLRIHPLPHLSAGLADLCALMNTYHPLVPP